MYEMGGVLYPALLCCVGGTVCKLEGEWDG